MFMFFLDVVMYLFAGVPQLLLVFRDTKKSKEEEEDPDWGSLKPGKVLIGVALCFLGLLFVFVCLFVYFLGDQDCLLGLIA